MLVVTGQDDVGGGWLWGVVNVDTDQAEDLTISSNSAPAAKSSCVFLLRLARIFLRSIIKQTKLSENIWVLFMLYLLKAGSLKISNTRKSAAFGCVFLSARRARVRFVSLLRKKVLYTHSLAQNFERPFRCISKKQRIWGTVSIYPNMLFSPYDDHNSHRQEMKCGESILSHANQPTAGAISFQLFWLSREKDDFVRSRRALAVGGLASHRH